MRADLSRRSILKFATTGMVATAPAMALAAPDRSLADPVQPSDEEQLEACITDLKSILSRMHPDCEPPTHGDMRSPLGSRHIMISVVKPVVQFTGDGLYEVNFGDGGMHLCDVRQDWSKGLRSLWAALRVDGDNVGAREWVTEAMLVRKVGM